MWIGGIALAHDVDHMRLLIEHGAIVDVRADTGRTPLLFCVHAGPSAVTVDAARFLLEKGSNPNNRDNDGNSILWTAYFSQNTVVRLMLQHGATVNDKDPLSGETLLHKLANCKSRPFHAETMEVLLEHGGNNRIRDNQGKLPLDVACARKVDDRERATDMNIIYVLFQRMLGDASLRSRNEYYKECLFLQ